MQIVRHQASVVSQILPTNANTHRHMRSYTHTQIYSIIGAEG